MPVQLRTNQDEIRLTLPPSLTGAYAAEGKPSYLPPLVPSLRLGTGLCCCTLPYNFLASDCRLEAPAQRACQRKYRMSDRGSNRPGRFPHNPEAAEEVPIYPPSEIPFLPVYVLSRRLTSHARLGEPQTRSRVKGNGTYVEAAELLEFRRRAPPFICLPVCANSIH